MNVWIIGGYLSKPHHFHRHAKMYQNLFRQRTGQDCDTHIITYPFKRGITAEPKHTLIDIYKDALDNNNDKLPDVVHLVSGASLVYGLTRGYTDLFSGSDKPRSAVFESGPMFCTSRQVSMYARFMLKFPETFYPFTDRVVDYMWKIGGNNQPEVYGFCDDIYYTDPNVRKLFIYSKRDPILDFEEIRRCVQKNTEKGADIFVLELDSSNHGRLVRRFEDQCSSAIEKFLFK